jgi:hypothetical protein
MNAKQLREQADRLFSKRGQFMTMCQEIAENFYVERADFTVRKDAGDEYAGNLMTSYPLQCRRDLGDQLQTMLRPTGKVWAHVSTQDPEREDNDSKQWLEHKSGVMRRAMYDRKSMFEAATAMADHDFSTFGQCVVSVRLNRDITRLMYRNWHIRDVVWMDNDEGGLQFVARKWKPTARTLVQLFPDCDQKIHKMAAKDPFCEYECMHIVCEAEMYDGQARMPYWSIYYDCTHNKVLEEVATWNIEYAIPRWKRVSGSQYAYSPATVIALPDARLIQAMTLTLLEAGEKAVNPPIIATMDAVRSDVALYAGGMTWIDYEYDEKTGEALRPMPIDTKGIPLGTDLQRDTRELISRAFFLNKINLPRPENARDMTAYEVGQRIQEYIRAALPIFAPMEAEYNGAVCELTWDLLFRNGAFGSPYDMPRSLRGAEINFRFESPLHDLIEQAKGQKWLEAKAIVADAMALDPSAADLMDARVALRDVLKGIGVPALWTRSESVVNDMSNQRQEQQAADQLLATMEQGSTVAANLAGARKDLATADAA